MAAGQKGSAFERSAELSPGVSFLEEEIRSGLTSSDSVSNFEAMCLGISESGLVSRKCRDCKGLGTRKLDEKRKEKWERRIAEAESPTVRARLRMDRAEETVCRSCAGSGKVVMERTRAASPCDDCDGLGDVRGDSCKRCLGRGFVFLGPVDYRAVTTRCERCKGWGSVWDEDVEDTCQLCRGAGYTIPCTIFEKGSSKKGKLPPGYEGGSQVETVVRPAGAAGGSVAWADEQEIADLGADSRLLTEVRRRDPFAASVLETYLGAEGARWKRHLWGQEFALWQLAPSGKRIIEDSRERPDIWDYADKRGAYRRGAGYLARPSDVIAKERAAEMKAKIPNIRRKELLRKADQESRDMLARARAVLLEVAAA